MTKTMQSSGSDDAELIPVVDGIVFRRSVDNMGWANLGGATIIIDALEDATQGDAVAEDIARTMPKQPVKAVVNTHTHGDHTALNRFFAKRFDCPIVNRRESDLTSDGQTFEGNTRRCLLLPVTACHSPSDAIVWFPDDQVVFTGDLFGWGMIPRVGGVDAAYLDKLCTLYQSLTEYRPKTVLPGHGPPASLTELQRCIQYLQELRETLLKGDFAELSPEEAEKRFPPHEDMKNWWRFPEWKHAHNLQMLAGK